MNQATEVASLSDAIDLIRAEKINAGKFVVHKSFLDRAWSELIMSAHRVGASHAELLAALPRGTVVELSMTGERGIGYANEPESRCIWLSVSLLVGGASRNFKVSLGIPDTDGFALLLSDQLKTLEGMVKLGGE
jgi:hypothetical protein